MHNSKFIFQFSSIVKQTIKSMQNYKWMERFAIVDGF